ncbi:MAG: hypothetical protein ACR2H4_19215 [Pyrinomonadaceae bacterium]
MDINSAVGRKAGLTEEKLLGVVNELSKLLRQIRKNAPSCPFIGDGGKAVLATCNACGSFNEIPTP